MGNPERKLHNSIAPLLIASKIFGMCPIQISQKFTISLSVFNIFYGSFLILTGLIYFSFCFLSFSHFDFSRKELYNYLKVVDISIYPVFSVIIGGTFLLRSKFLRNIMKKVFDYSNLIKETHDLLFRFSLAEMIIFHSLLLPWVFLDYFGYESKDTLGSYKKSILLPCFEYLSITIITTVIFWILNLSRIILYFFKELNNRISADGDLENVIIDYDEICNICIMLNQFFGVAATSFSCIAFLEVINVFYTNIVNTNYNKILAFIWLLITITPEYFMLHWFDEISKEVSRTKKTIY